jgi:LPS export ABC transporter protein LptC
MPFRIFTVLAVVALAVSTWILSSPGRSPPAESGVPVALTPGYYFKNATLTDYDEQGTPVVRIAAERIDQIAHGPEVALSAVRVDYQPPSGAPWVMTGDQAHVEAGGKAVDVSGDVRLLGQSQALGQSPGRRAAPVIRTEFLHYDVPSAVATTSDEVHLDFGQQIVSARGLAANLKDRTLRLESHVNGRFHP